MHNDDTENELDFFDRFDKIEKKVKNCVIIKNDISKQLEKIPVEFDKTFR